MSKSHTIKNTSYPARVMSVLTGSKSVPQSQTISSLARYDLVPVVWAFSTLITEDQISTAAHKCLDILETSCRLPAWV